MNKILETGLVGILASGVVYVGVYGWTGITATTGDTLDAAKWNEMVGFTVPAGAVMAFDLDTCPTGWTEQTATRGRTIIGTNPSPLTGPTISVRARGSTIGEETHVLTTAELAAHRHTYTRTGGGAGSQPGILADNVGGNQVTNYDNYMNDTGSSQAFNVMQPSIAYLYCKKDS